MRTTSAVASKVKLHKAYGLVGVQTECEENMRKKDQSLGARARFEVADWSGKKSSQSRAAKYLASRQGCPL